MQMVNVRFLGFESKIYQVTTFDSVNGSQIEQKHVILHQFTIPNNKLHTAVNA